MILKKFWLSACIVGTSFFSCASFAQTAPLALDTQSKAVMDLAIELYPTIFPNGSEVGSYQGYLYRFFAGTGVYAGFKDGQVFLMGGIFGNQITSKGTATSVLAMLQDVKAKLPKVRGAGLTLSPAYKGLATFANSVPYSNGGSFVYSQGVGIQNVTVSYTNNVNTGAQLVQVTIMADLSGVDAFISRGSYSVLGCVLTAVNGFSAPVCSSVGVTFDKTTGDIYFVNTPLQQGGSGTSVVSTLNGSLTFPKF
jgi:hypothetical protein